MGVPARFVGAALHVFQKPQKRGKLFKAILDGFPKSQRTLVAFVSVLLSETAGAGNGLIRPGLLIAEIRLDFRDKQAGFLKKNASRRDAVEPA